MTSAGNSFEPIADRDAWSTIRGFVYQVDMTILRWLQLTDNQILELEKGEDIDIIKADIDAGKESRELEQVKYRQKKLTLNTDFVFEAMLNFFVHRRSNPSHLLLFRLVTNASWTIERPSLFPEGQSGIQVWMELQNDPTVDESNQLFLRIQDHFYKKAGAILTDVDDASITENQKTVKLFQTFLKDPKEFLVFLKHFQWSTQNIDNVNMSETIKRTLLSLNVAPNVSTAELLYPRLFYFVFKLLTNSGSKLLDKASLVRESTLPNLAEKEQTSYLVVEGLLNSVIGKVALIEETLNETRVQLADLLNDVSIIKTNDAIFDFSLSRISFASPLLVNDGTTRKLKVDFLQEAFSRVNWIHLCGINGTGKTQLAILLSQRFQQTAWIDLRPYNTDSHKCSLYITASIEKLSRRAFDNTPNWFELAVRSLAKELVIVINDIPRLEHGTRLTDQFIFLFNNLDGTKLITTSNFSITTHIKSYINEEFLVEYTDLNFIDVEVKEFLTNKSAPDFIIQRSRLITDISSGNARIIASIVQYLKAANWATNGGEFVEAIFLKEFTKEFLEDVEISIKKYISDLSSRELLYRLSFFHWPFDLEDIVSVSKIDKAISHPREKMLDLLHIWIQQTNNEFLLSPLVHDIGSSNLDSNVIEQIHLSIARTIIQSKSLNQVTATRCITSFIRGKDYNNAGNIYLNVLQSVKDDHDIKLLDDWGYLNYWQSNDIPPEMSIIVRAAIRHEQIRLFIATGKDPESLFERLLSYQEQEDLSTSERLLITSFILINWRRAELSQYWSYLNYFLNNRSDIEEPFTEFLKRDSITAFIWFPVLHIATIPDLKNWLIFVDRITLMASVNVLHQEEFERAIYIICRRRFDYEKKQQTANWDTVDEFLKILESYFNERKIDNLQGIVASFLIRTKFIRRNDLAEAETTTVAVALKLKSISAHFFLYDTLGKLYFDYDKEKSFKWLNSALTTSYKPKTYYLETLVFAASAVSNESAATSVTLFSKALEFAKSSDEFDEIEIIPLQGELAIGQWANNCHRESFESFEEMISLLLSTKALVDEMKWVRNFTLAGHALGYIAPAVANEKTPELTMAGDIYIEPTSGFFVFNEKDLRDVFTERNIPILMIHLARFAEAINMNDKSFEWSQKAFDLARKNKDQKILLMVAGAGAQYALINFKLEEAFEMHLLFAAVSSLGKGSTEERYAAMGAINLNELFNNKPSPVWNSAEDISATFAITPFLIMAINFHLEGKSGAVGDAEKVIKLLNDYGNTASDKGFWSVLTKLCTNILRNQISWKALFEEGKVLGQQEKRNLQTICNIGTLYRSDQHEFLLFQLINTAPYIVNQYGQWRSIMNSVMIPFLKQIAIKTLALGFVGSRSELITLTNSIRDIDGRIEHAPQLILQPLVKEFDFKLPDDRRRWLLDFAVI